MLKLAHHSDKFQDLFGAPSHRYFLRSIPGTNGRRIVYKLEAYCSTKWRCTATFLFPQSSDASKAQRYKCGVHCSTNWRCTAVLFPTCLHASFQPFCPLCWPPLFLLLSAPFALFSLSKSALFCRVKGTAQSLERGSFSMDLSTKSGKEIPSRNLREKGQF